MSNACELYHHGVKGMKWGIRKKHKTKSRKSNVKSKEVVDRYAAGRHYVESKFSRNTRRFISDTAAYASGVLYCTALFTTGGASAALNAAGTVTNMVSLLVDDDDD